MEPLEQFKIEYAKLAKKYGLPSFEEINADIFLQDFLNEKKFVPQSTLGFVRGRMVDMLGSWVNYLHNFIMPSQQSAIWMKEYQALTDDDRTQISAMIQEMMILQRESVVLGLEKDETADADFIKRSFVLWKMNKKKLLLLAKKSLENWKKKEEETKERFGY
ncbi:hypothetical protein HZB02_05230 [Candidatus Woesearchaeota archaeon]|nr:hypothetical protein [Candidatus Woesearchaeota archaeon]